MPQGIGGTKEWKVMEYKLEAIVLPVADVDRAKEFYRRIGFREDLDYLVEDEDFRVVHFTPPGSHCSVIVGSGISTARPGSVQNLHLVVDDIERARAALVAAGVEVSEIFHDEGGVFHHAGTEKRVPGLYPGRRSYGSFASFSDPDGNGFLLQEVTERIPGR
jgi:catechol 2,3-dioxygenase-like lactoylglutathione lyase family enzyme